MEQYFNYANYQSLIKVLGEKAKKGDAIAPEAMKYVKKSIDAICEYVRTVDVEETQIRIAYARLEGEELRDTVERADRLRRFAHEAAIAHTSSLNQMCLINGLELIFSGDIEDRYQVADFCGEVTKKLFDERRL